MHRPWTFFSLFDAHCGLVDATLHCTVYQCRRPVSDCIVGRISSWGIVKRDYKKYFKEKKKSKRSRTFCLFYVFYWFWRFLSFNAWNVFFGLEKKTLFEPVLNVPFLQQTLENFKKECFVCFCTITSSCFWLFLSKDFMAWIFQKLVRSQTDSGKWKPIVNDIFQTGLTRLVRHYR